MAASNAAVRYKDLTQSWSDPSGHLRVVARADAIDSRPVILTMTLRYLAASQTNTWDYVLEMVKLCVEEDGRLVTQDDDPAQVSGAPKAGTFVFQPREHLLPPATSDADARVLSQTDLILSLSREALLRKGGFANSPPAIQSRRSASRAGGLATKYAFNAGLTALPAC